MAATQDRAAKEEEDKPKRLAGVTKEEEEEDKREPAEGNSSRILRLPDWYIERLQKRGVRRPRPLREGLLDHNPRLREMVLALKEAANAKVEVKENILMQVRDKGYAEVMLEYVDGVVIFDIVPKFDLD